MDGIAHHEVVSISYNDLLRFHDDDDDNDDSGRNALLMDKIGQAFGNGDTCLGLLSITDVPRFDELRNRLLPLARQVAHLSPDELKAVTDEASDYQVGWSHGKETVQGDKPDVAKGSFYANPLTENLQSCRPTVPQDVVDANPSFFAPNVWPTDAVPALQGAFVAMGQLVCHVGRLLARPCDAYVKSKCPEYPDHKLETVLTESRFCKGRLLHYFAMEETKPASNGSECLSDFDWCGWHNDHGSLTGLVPAMYLDDTSGKEIACPDASAGLYIRSRSGDLVHVQTRTLAFQIGETSQIHTGGILQATPHAVRACRSTTSCYTSTTTRESFAVFMEPEFDGDMALPLSKSVHDVQQHTSHLPSNVRTLASRWKEGMTFGDFSHATFAAFY